MPAHDLAQRGEIGRAAGCGVEDGGHLAEVARAEETGGDDRQCFGVAVASVVELVDGAAGVGGVMGGSDVARGGHVRAGEHS